MLSRRESFRLLAGAAAIPLVAQLPPVDMAAAEQFVTKKVMTWRVHMVLEGGAQVLTAEPIGEFDETRVFEEALEHEAAKAG